MLMKQETMGWQWHQLNHMQIICTLLQTDNHASTSSLSFFTGRMLFLTLKQQCQSTEGNTTCTIPCTTSQISQKSIHKFLYNPSKGQTD